MIREPKMADLVEYVCRVQPELDPAAAQRLLADEDIREWVAGFWTHERQLRENLLALFLVGDEKATLS